ncbi:cholinephosphate cytidylyltransferase [Athelia psychrophila]|uniref:choline-phosphate cytidylyltransferase n=1 Tax=Athelia psychrophila TaxID=1759441 RepID=A0A165YJ90_9AGAM|nr:cholinephosphate cytidylyltransferase [Fibularhizoctonia sp. CBS 109695]
MSESPADILHHHKKTLHTKRSFGRYPRSLDSPAYDASEEDNDPLTDDAASIVSVHSSRNNRNGTASTMSTTVKAARKHQLASDLTSDDGVDSPTYDGDIESSTTAGPDSHKTLMAPAHHNRTSSATSSTSVGSPPAIQTQGQMSPRIAASPPIFISQPSDSSVPTPAVGDEPAVAAASRAAFNPAGLTPADIRAFVQKAIDGESWRKYKINSPPTDRPVRIYADGVYDLFHFGHALQLRQAKLAFPEVHVLVGVCSDELVESHKANSIMTHAERCETARHCRWVDEIVAEAPWVIDADFIAKYQIDYVAHDEDPYGAEGHDDVYSYVKAQGKFIPTRRTPGVSTSELLERIVSGYRKRDFDKKLEKMGHAELKAEGSDYDDSRPASRSMSPTLGGGLSPITAVLRPHNI